MKSFSDISVIIVCWSFDMTTSGDIVPHTFQYRYGRLAFMQDGNMRAAGRAMFTLYGDASRVAVTGMCDDDAMGYGVKIPSMTAVLDETAIGLCHTGYLVTDYQYFQNAELLTATYYDDYAFLILDAFSALPQETTNGYATAKGLVTGTLTAVLGNADSNIPPIATVTFYDNEDRPVRTFSTTHLADTYEQTETTYTLDDRPKTVSHTLTKGDKTYTDDYEYAYDNVGRLSDTKAAFPGRENKVGIVKNYYNSTGLLHRTVNDTIQTDYGYDIRGSICMVINDRVYQQILRNPSGSISYIMENWIEHTYEYDNAGRLLSEVCDCGGSLGGVFSSSYIYDKNSNITGVIRKGYPKGSHPPGTVDDLTLSYRGNQLVRAGDMADEVLRERSYDFQDGAEEDVEYRYDANGNLTFDANRGITDITYNVLNLPSKILLCDGTSINYIYDASGAKRATTHEIEDGSAAAPSEFGMFPYWPFSDSVIERDYLGNYEFRGGSLLRINTSYGYYTPRNAAFTPYLRDYQGNNRNAAVYYAYGLPTSYTSYNVDDPYLYGGKRLEAYKGLNIYDFDARTYTPDIVRFMQPDPKAHDYHWLSPYAYCGGDPINRIDPDGCDFWYTNDMSEILNFYNSILAGASTYDFSNWQHTPDIEFLNHVVYDDRTFKLYATTTSVIDGSFTVTCTIHTFPIYPVVNYYNKQVYEPVKGILDKISYFLNPWTYNDGVTTWSVGRDGRINGLAPKIGYPPLVGKGKIWKNGRYVEKIGKNKKKAPAPNTVQNKQVEQLAKKYKLNQDQRRIVHDYIGGEGYSYHEIEQAILDLFY